MNKFLKTGLVATAAVALSLVGFGEVFGYGGSGGGGSAPRANLNLGFVINNGDLSTNSTNVTLTLEGGISVTGVAISNTPDFDGSVVVPYQPLMPWTLASGIGEKTVYVKFFRANSNSNSPTLSDSIMFNPAQAPKAVLGVKIVNLDELIAKTYLGQNGGNVFALQNGLKAGGFMPATFPSTGFYGPVTNAAVRKYLASIGGSNQPTTPPTLPVDLDPLIGDLRFGMRSQKVAELQTALRNLGFFPKYIRSTGYFGPITRSAVEKYLASKKI